MLMYGTSMMCREVRLFDSLIAFNLTSLSEDFYTLPNIIPPATIPRTSERDFDIAYCDYILGNDVSFMEFFSIVYNLYLGVDIFLVIDEDFDWSENVLESLLKIIQQRYGYNAVYIGSDEDFIYAKNQSISKFAPGYGLYNLDQDKERFTYLIEDMKIKGGMLPPWLIWGNDGNVSSEG